MSTIRKLTVQGLKPGDTLTVERSFTHDEVQQFADLTRDYNPIHFERRFTTAKKIPDLICHGLLVGGMITEIGGQIGWLASGMRFVFKAPVYPGDRIACTLTIMSVDAKGRARAEAQFRNQDGRLVLDGELTGIIPGETERQVLQHMMDEGDPTNACRGKPYAVRRSSSGSVSEG
jgi:acyl dehydratase